MVEKRKSFRRRTLLDGHIEIDKLNGWTMDCTVRNLSEDGACLALPPDTIVPSAFQLKVSGSTPVPARLVWYQQGRAGVALSHGRGGA